ncbi:MAG: HypC/HybG/HupF family hydrogenase formation chaperone [Actinomycetota bacterium]
MCLGIPGQIVELRDDNPHLAIADVFGARRSINVGLIDDGVEVGDWVLLHVGFALEKLDEHGLAMARASLDLLGAGPDEASASTLEAELAQREASRAQTEQQEKEGTGRWAS